MATLRRIAAATAALRCPTVAACRPTIAHSRRFSFIARQPHLNVAVAQSPRSLAQPHRPLHLLSLQKHLPSPLLARSKHTYVPGRIKVASKRRTKKYKLKNHKGATARWLLMSDGMFKRARAGRTRINRIRRTWKRNMRKMRVRATSTQRNLLKKLIPYYRKRYLR